MSTTEAVLRLFVYATLWLAAMVLVAIIMRRLWMWLFGVSELIEEVRALRNDVRSLRQNTPAGAPLHPASMAPTVTPSTPGDWPERSGQDGDDTLARSLRYTD